MKKNIAIHWFRQDLRLSDNPALANAADSEQILPIYILDDKNSGEDSIGSASRLWLHYSLVSLNKSLNDKLSFYKGNSFNILAKIIDSYDVEAVYWNRCYEPWRIDLDTKIKEFLKKKGIKVMSSNGSLLWEPWDIKKDDRSSYRVFTPFYRKCCLIENSPREPSPQPKYVQYIGDNKLSISIEKLNLLSKVRSDKQLEQHWDFGELAAHKNFQYFIDKGLSYYKEGRNIPAGPYVSRMSPHLHFGEISPNQLWYGIQGMSDEKNVDNFCRELGWREFSYSLLYYNPDIPKKNLQTKFDSFPWEENNKSLSVWQKGQTGIPMVDAGMRELWQTGYMHNRVRMIVGSFLVKNLRIHWSHGKKWFWETLLDADLANNSASWQWIAGCGVDAAPYFRIFNPVTQGQKFDPDGRYIRKFVPEISSLPNKFLFDPWNAPKNILQDSGIQLGKSYPNPVVDLKQSREAALQAFQVLKNK